MTRSLRNITLTNIIQLIRLIKTVPDLITSLTIMIKLVSEKKAYILFKHHKQKFNNHKQARLINPAFTDLGLVSKNVIQIYY